MTANSATAPPNTASASSPVGHVRLQAAAMGLGRGQEHRQRGTGDQCSAPRRLGNVLVDPEPAQDECEDQLGDQERLDDRELTAVESDGLEGKSARGRRPTEEPERLADQVPDEHPATVRVGHTRTRRVLGHQMDRVRQRSGQSEGDRDSHVTRSDRALRAEPTGGFWTLARCLSSYGERVSPSGRLVSTTVDWFSLRSGGECSRNARAAGQAQ